MCIETQKFFNYRYIMIFQILRQHRSKEKNFA